MFYSQTEPPKSHIIKSEEEKYLDKGYMKVDESAMCVVRLQFYNIFIQFWKWDNQSK